MRRRHLRGAAGALLAGCLLAATACSDDDGGSPPSTLPAGDLHGAVAVGDGETIWVLGGTIVTDAVWDEVTTPSYDLPRASAEAVDAGRNGLATQYDTDGRVLQSVDLGEVQVLQVFSHPSTEWSGAASPKGAVFAGVACIEGEGQGPCGMQGVVLAVADGRARRVPIEAPQDDVRVLGAVGDEVILAVGRRGGSFFAGESARAYALDPSDPELRQVPLPPHVGFARSLCLLGDELAVVTVDPTGDGQTRLSVGLVPISGSRPFDPVEIVLPSPTVYETALACTSDGPVVLELVNLGSFPLPVAHLVDLGARTAGEPSALPGEVLPELPTVGGDLLVAIPGPALLPRPLRWVDGVSADPGPPVDLDDSAVVVGDRLLDVTGLLAHRPGDDGPPPVEVEVPPVDARG